MSDDQLQEIIQNYCLPVIRDYDDDRAGTCWYFEWSGEHKDGQVKGPLDYTSKTVQKLRSSGFKREAIEKTFQEVGNEIAIFACVNIPEEEDIFCVIVSVEP